MGREAFAFKVDVTDLVQTKNMAQKTVDIFGAIDILVNNAGWYKWEFFLQNEEVTWDKLISINLRGTINCFKAVLPYMTERQYGKILSIASDAGRIGSSGDAVYAGTKGGIIAFSKSIAWEVARYRINVNCLAPGAIETDFYEEYVKESPGRKEKIIKAIPFRRLGKPEDIANVVAFLVSDEAEYITGQTLSVNGGLSML
jgi:2-hydroxycyclohexanecarboxyl-CoA dehydrogenase